MISMFIQGANKNNKFTMKSITSQGFYLALKVINFLNVF
jgi:hypothetical protein